MKRNLFFVIMLLAGCETTWDGELPGHTYEIKFIRSNGSPVSEVKPVCSGNGVWPSEAIAEEINRSNSRSNQAGNLVMSHKSYEVGGTDYELLWFKWSSKESLVACKFMKQGRLVAEGRLLQFYKPTSVIIKD